MTESQYDPGDRVQLKIGMSAYVAGEGMARGSYFEAGTTGVMIDGKDGKLRFKPDGIQNAYFVMDNGLELERPAPVKYHCDNCGGVLGEACVKIAGFEGKRFCSSACADSYEPLQGAVDAPVRKFSIDLSLQSDDLEGMIAALNHVAHELFSENMSAGKSLSAGHSRSYIADYKVDPEMTHDKYMAENDALVEFMASDTKPPPVALDRLDEIEERLAARTPGKWYEKRLYDLAADDCDFDSNVINSIMTEKSEGCQREKKYNCRGCYVFWQEDGGPVRIRPRDVDFIIHAPGDLEWSVAEIKRLRVEQDYDVNLNMALVRENGSNALLSEQLADEVELLTAERERLLVRNGELLQGNNALARRNESLSATLARRGLDDSGLPHGGEIDPNAKPESYTAIERGKPLQIRYSDDDDHNEALQDAFESDEDDNDDGRYERGCS